MSLFKKNILSSKIIIPVLVVWVMLFVGLAPAIQDHFKIRDRFEKIASVLLCSTGLSQAGIDTSKAAQFNAHILNGALYPNTLYQAFLAVHYDEMDTVLTFHSAAGRTYSGRFPGDTNTFTLLQRFPYIPNGRVDSNASVFSIPGGSGKMKIQQNLYALKDSSYRIYLDYIFTFYVKALSDTIRFSNIKILFGYDGDIGSSLGGYSNDSCGYYRDDSTKLVYIYDWFDTTKAIFAGIQLLKGGLADSAGNMPLFHQTINQFGSSLQSLDTVLYRMMSTPSFDATLQNTDQTIYWAIELPDKFTESGSDTLSDTIRFVWVNGFSKENLIRSAKGLKVNAPVNTTPPVIPNRTRLLSNYPNPFNPSTTIHYELSYSGNVTLIVYNALGQPVRTLVKRFQKAGVYSVDWDGKDDSGKAVAGGLYIYRLKSGDWSRSKKCLLIK